MVFELNEDYGSVGVGIGRGKFLLVDVGVGLVILGLGVEDVPFLFAEDFEVVRPFDVLTIVPNCKRTTAAVGLGQGEHALVMEV